MRTVLSGSLYAYEIPPHYRRSTPAREEEQPPERTATDNEGAGSTNEGAEPTNEGVESTNEGVEPTSEGAESTNEGAESTNEGVESTNEGVEPPTEGAGPPTEGAEPPIKEVEQGAESDVASTDKDGGTVGSEIGQKEEEEVKTNDTKQSSAPPIQPRPSYCNPRDHGFIFGIHRRTVSIDDDDNDDDLFLVKIRQLFCINSKESSDTLQLPNDTTLYTDHTPLHPLQGNMEPSTTTNNTRPPKH